MTWEMILWIYVAFLVLGGVMGFIKAQSKASLIASLAFGVPLALCAARILNVNYLAEGLVCFLALFFGKRFAQSKKFMPGGLMTILSVIVLVMRFLVLSPAK